MPARAGAVDGPAACLTGLLTFMLHSGQLSFGFVDSTLGCMGQTYMARLAAGSVAGVCASAVGAAIRECPSWSPDEAAGGADSLPEVP